MLTVGLALIAAIGYGAGDFTVGLAARRAPVLRVTWLMFAVGGAAIAVFLPWVHAGTLTLTAAAWGALSGVGCGAGALALFAGYKRAPFSVAGPLEAALGAGLAFLAGLMWGERPGSWALLGLLLVLPAILVVSFSAVPRDDIVPASIWRLPGLRPVHHDLMAGDSPDPLPRDFSADSVGRRAPRRHWSRRAGRSGAGIGMMPVHIRPGSPGARTGVGWGIAAGVGCAVSLITLDRASPAAGVWPVLAEQVAAMLTVAAAAAVTGDLRIPAAGSRALCMASGVLGALATICYLLAAHSGLMAVAAVITSSFPVVTAGLGLVIAHERLGVTRLAGLALAIVSISLIAVGG